MRKNLLNLVEQEMARRRLDNERTEAARKQEIEQKYPVIRALITERCGGSSAGRIQQMTCRRE